MPLHATEVFPDVPEHVGRMIETNARSLYNFPRG